jgi:hypothetical protein
MGSDREKTGRLVKAARPVPFDTVETAARTTHRRGVRGLLPAAAVATATAVAVVVAVIAMRGPGAPTPGHRQTGQSSMSVEEVYDRVGRAITRPGMVYHAAVTTRLGGVFGDVRTTERWADVRRDVAREQAPNGSVILVRRGVRYSRGPGGASGRERAPRCGGGNAGGSLVLDCATYIDRGSLRTEDGEYGGRPAVVLIQRGEFVGEGLHRVEERLYVDRQTFLPIAKVREDEIRVGDGTTSESRRVEYEHSWIRSDDLPEDLFDLESIHAVDGGD